MIFKEATNEAYEVLQEAMQYYCSVYTDDLNKAVDVHQEALNEELTKYFDLVLIGRKFMKIPTITF